MVGVGGGVFNSLCTKSFYCSGVLACRGIEQKNSGNLFDPSHPHLRQTATDGQARSIEILFFISREKLNMPYIAM